MSLRRTKTTQNCYANTELDFIITKNIIKIVAPFKVWRKTHIHKFNCFILCLNIFPSKQMPKSQIWKKTWSQPNHKDMDNFSVQQTNHNMKHHYICSWGSWHSQSLQNRQQAKAWNPDQHPSQCNVQKLWSLSQIWQPVLLVHCYLGVFRWSSLSNSR